MSEEREEAARTYREAAEAYLGGGKVEAAGVFHRPGWLSDAIAIEALIRALDWLDERLTHGRVGRLRGSFLLAVTRNEVHAFKYAVRSESFRIEKQLATLRE
jgi:hypothetical protein